MVDVGGDLALEPGDDGVQRESQQECQPDAADGEQPAERTLSEVAQSEHEHGYLSTSAGARRPSAAAGRRDAATAIAIPAAAASPTAKGVTAMSSCGATTMISCAAPIARATPTRDPETAAAIACRKTVE